MTERTVHSDGASKVMATLEILSVTDHRSPEGMTVAEVARDALLCTGHVSRAECSWLLAEAQARGITRILLTHPSYTVPGMGPTEIGELAGRGAHVEITAFQLWHQPGMTIGKLAAVARAAGDRLVLSSDAGQPDSPPPPEALLLLVEALAAEGVDRARLEDAADSVPRQLALP